MEHDDALGDDEPGPPLLPPDDRIWRHPSELVEHGPGVGPAPAPAPPGARARSVKWVSSGGPMGVVVALAGAGLAVLGVATWGGVGQVRTVVIPAVEQVVAPGATSPMSASWDTAVSLAEQLGPAVVEVRVDGPGGEGRGSGVVFRSDGHILASRHVVAGAGRITVVMSGGENLTGKLVGSDAETDIAVVKIAREGMRSAVLGSVVSVQAGQMAMTVGSPDARGRPTIAVGVVNGLGRRVSVGGGPPLTDLIETSVPVADGRSGGPLVDASGAVIGITTDLAGGGTPAVGFATGIDAARDVAVQLIATGRVTRAWLGIEGEDLDASTAAALGLTGAALVRGVKADSPASRGGLLEGDVVTAVDGTTVRSMAGLKAALRWHQPGHVVTLGVLRASSPHTARVALTERPPLP